jgi:hypothetical protein
MEKIRHATSGVHRSHTLLNFQDIHGTAKKKRDNAFLRNRRSVENRASKQKSKLYTNSGLSNNPDIIHTASDHKPQSLHRNHPQHSGASSSCSFMASEQPWFLTRVVAETE